MKERQGDIQRIQMAFESQGKFLTYDLASMAWRSYSKKMMRHSWFPVPTDDKEIIKAIKSAALYEPDNKFSIVVLSLEDIEKATARIVEAQRILEQSEGKTKKEIDEQIKDLVNKTKHL